MLVAPTEEEVMVCRLRGRESRVALCGVSVSIIDFTLSRLDAGQSPSPTWKAHPEPEAAGNVRLVGWGVGGGRREGAVLRHVGPVLLRGTFWERAGEGKGFSFWDETLYGFGTMWFDGYHLWRH